ERIPPAPRCAIPRLRLWMQPVWLPGVLPSRLGRRRKRERGGFARQHGGISRQARQPKGADDREGCEERRLIRVSARKEQAYQNRFTAFRGGACRTQTFKQHGGRYRMPFHDRRAHDLDPVFFRNRETGGVEQKQNGGCLRMLPVTVGVASRVGGQRRVKPFAEV